MPSGSRGHPHPKPILRNSRAARCGARSRREKGAPRARHSRLAPVADSVQPVSDRAARAPLWGTLLLLLVTVGGCASSRYLLEQSGGQLRLLAGRQSISETLLRGGLSPRWRKHLALVRVAREFAYEQLGLRRTEAYSLWFDTGGSPVAYNLSAAPRTQLRAKTWLFPIVGRVPYLGFFRREGAQAAQARLRAQGFDTQLRAVAAFSSLGYFADPVFSPMLDEAPDRLIELVLHESTHTTVFLPGRVSFNESFAVFVGQQGTLELLKALYGRGSPQWRHAKRRFSQREAFAALVERLARRLRGLYASKLAEAAKIRRRRELFSAAQAEHLKLFAEPKAAFVARPLNNAVVLSHGRYLGGLGFHRAVFRCCGASLRKMVALYRSAARQRESPPTALATACGFEVRSESTRVSD